MSNDTRGEDTILGTALARAIDSQPIRSTPFERSRVAVRMAGGGRSPLFPVLAAAAAVVLGLALGTALLGQRGPTDPGGVATQPTASPDTTASPGGSPSPSPSATDGRVERLFVYFAQDQLPPSGGLVEARVTEEPTPEGNIAARLRVLGNTPAPQGEDQRYSNQLFSSRTKPTVNEVRIEADLARVDFTVPNGDWGVSGSAASLALLGQLVYTATEEPGIKRVLFTENGGKPTTIDQLTIDEPLTRENVLPYEGVKTEERIALEDDPRAATNTWGVAKDLPSAVTRLTIEMAAASATDGFWSPRLSAELRANTDERAIPGKWLLQVTLPGTTDAKGTPPSVEVRNSSPLRAVSVNTDSSGTTYRLGLDDARPWRISLEPGKPGTMRLHVDIGGHPQAVSDSVAVYFPVPGREETRTFTLTGTARAFEAHVSWRIKDSSDREVATGFATASLGTSPVWGTFTTEVKIPDNVSGVVTLEVFWPSPRDGADVGTVAIPLRVR